MLPPNHIEEALQSAVAFAPIESSAGAPRRGAAWRNVVQQDWALAVVFGVLDIAVWIILYTFVGLQRGDAFYTTPLQFVVVEAIQLAVILQALYVIGGYGRDTDISSLAYATEHLLAMAAAAALSSLIVYSAATYDQTMRPSRGVLLLSFVLFTPISLEYRRIFRLYAAASTANRAFLVIGNGALALQFYIAYKKSKTQQRLEFPLLDRARAGTSIAGPGSPVLEGDLATKLQNLGDRYSGVILAERVDQLAPELLEQLVRIHFHRTRVYTLESFYEAHWRCVPVDSIDPFWPLQMGFQLARTSPYNYAKRICDVVLAGIALLLLWPFLALVAAVIWCANGSPVFFQQERVGREGATFRILKFRTMFLRPEGEEGEIYTSAGDPRITRVGRWLRKLRFDELPQLWNVLCGQMSLIGPRAEWVVCADRYERSIPFYHFRHLVKPGITGWAQVNYPYGASDEDAIEKLKYDLYYIRRYSLKLDAMIVLKTVQTMLFGRGR